MTSEQRRQELEKAYRYICELAEKIQAELAERGTSSSRDSIRRDLTILHCTQVLRDVAYDMKLRRSEFIDPAIMGYPEEG
jgi:hypothetical protein